MLAAALDPSQVGEPSTDGETGAVTFVQRFDSTLGCFVHFHVLLPDGLFRADDAEAVVFREGPAPTRADIADVAVHEDILKRILWGTQRPGNEHHHPEGRDEHADHIGRKRLSRSRGDGAGAIHVRCHAKRSSCAVERREEPGGGK